MAFDEFGYSVAVSGTTMVVGAPFHADSAGSAYVFTETKGRWRLVTELQAADTVEGDEFGWSVAISGMTAVIGAPFHAMFAGRAYVFTETAGQWTQVVELKGSDTATYDDFADAVAISAGTAVFGAPYAGGGRAYVFTETAGRWHQAAELKGHDTAAFDEFGSSVAISGTNAVIGAPLHDNSVGGAYIFTEKAGRWEQTAGLKGRDSTARDEFGWSLGISGTTAVIGAPFHDNSVGGIYVFADKSGHWEQTAGLKGSDVATGDEFGHSVAISGGTAVVDAPFQANGSGTYLFGATGGSWKQVTELKDPDTVPNDLFGWSVGVSGSAAVVGAYAEAAYAGRAYVFEA